MKKVLVARDIRAALEKENTFLNRTDMQVFSAGTNDEVLSVHRAEKVDLIIANYDLAGMSGEKLYGLIREDAALRTVSLILVCANTPDAIKECSQCRANAILLQPLHSVLLMAKAEQLLDIPARETLRVLLSARVDGSSGDGSFYCRTGNISATGMMIETNKRLAEGARLSCQFYLPDATRMQMTGKIVRIIQQRSSEENYQYGLMFTDVAPEARQLLLAFVESMAYKAVPG